MQWDKEEVDELDSWPDLQASFNGLKVALTSMKSGYILGIVYGFEFGSDALEVMAFHDAIVGEEDSKEYGAEYNLV